MIPASAIILVGPDLIHAISEEVVCLWRLSEKEKRTLETRLAAMKAVDQRKEREAA